MVASAIGTKAGERLIPQNYKPSSKFKFGNRRPQFAAERPSQVDRALGSVWPKHRREAGRVPLAWALTATLSAATKPSLSRGLDPGQVQGPSHSTLRPERPHGSGRPGQGRRRPAAGGPQSGPYKARNPLLTAEAAASGARPPSWCQGSAVPVCRVPVTKTRISD